MARLKNLLVLSGLVALAAATLSCSGNQKRSSTDPYATESAFCQSWAKAACNAKVVDACGAKDVAACVSRQSSYCLGLVPPYYDSKNAKVCVTAVKDAYADAKLTSEELKTVRDLQGDCGKLNAGPLGVGETCSADDQCNNVADLACIKKGTDPQGTCQVPLLQQGGFACTEPNQACDVGFYCDGQNCLARPGDGQVCNKESKPCQEDYNCTGTTGDLHCSPKGDVSATCALDGDCKSGICAKPSQGAGSCVENVVLSPFDPFCPNLK